MRERSLNTYLVILKDELKQLQDTIDGKAKQYARLQHSLDSCIHELKVSEERMLRLSRGEQTFDVYHLQNLSQQVTVHRATSNALNLQANSEKSQLKELQLSLSNTLTKIKSIEKLSKRRNAENAKEAQLADWRHMDDLVLNRRMAR